MRESASLMTEKSTFHNQGQAMTWQSEICILITAQPSITNGGNYIIKQGMFQRKGQALLGGRWGDVPFVSLPNYRLSNQ